MISLRDAGSARSAIRRADAKRRDDRRAVTGARVVDEERAVGSVAADETRGPASRARLRSTPDPECRETAWRGTRRCAGFGCARPARRRTGEAEPSLTISTGAARPAADELRAHGQAPRTRRLPRRCGGCEDERGALPALEKIANLTQQQHVLGHGGSAAGVGSSFAFALANWRTIQKITKARMMKLMTMVRKLP